jgi:Zn2+/Cd2+-exporting ATPase
MRPKRPWYNFVMKFFSLLDLKKPLFYEILATLLSLILMVVGTLTAAWQYHPIFWGLAFIIGGFFKAKEGLIKTIQEKSLNVEFLMIAAALAAFITGEYAEGAVLIFIFAVSGVLESIATAQSEKALTSLIKLKPKTAIKINQNQETTVSVDNLQIGDIVRVKAGQQIPTDGVVINGQVGVDQSSITGEFAPVTKSIGMAVFGGTLVVDGSLDVRIEKNPNDSMIQKMIELVKRAQFEKTQAEKSMITFEKVYVYLVIVLAILVMVVPPMVGWLEASEAFRRGVIVLVVGSPCALVASISPALLSTLSHGAKKGILVKSGRYLEKLNTINVVAFDKTGTITTGKPQIKQVYFHQRIDETKYLTWIINAERQSNHPLANAVARHYPHEPVLAVEMKEVSGQGVILTLKEGTLKIGKFDHDKLPAFDKELSKAKAAGLTIILFVLNQTPIGFFGLADTIRPDVKKVMSELMQMKVTPVMLTGDHEETAKRIAEEVGIKVFHANCLPSDKVSIIHSYQQQGKKVLMVGDGINDAPSIASATIGVSMGDATDVSLETSDIVIMNNNLGRIPYLLTLTKKMKMIIKQNIIFSITVIALLLLTNVFGFLVLRLGVIGHEMSTILVILNSLRLLSFKKAS